MITPLGAIESEYLIQTCTGPSDFNHPDVAALLVLGQYLTATEGPFWKHIRGDIFISFDSIFTVS